MRIMLVALIAACGLLTLLVPLHHLARAAR